MIVYSTAVEVYEISVMVARYDVILDVDEPVVTVLVPSVTNAVTVAVAVAVTCFVLVHWLSG